MMIMSFFLSNYLGHVHPSHVKSYLSPLNVQRQHSFFFFFVDQHLQYVSSTRSTSVLMWIDSSLSLFLIRTCFLLFDHFSISMRGPCLFFFPSLLSSIPLSIIITLTKMPRGWGALTFTCRTELKILLDRRFLALVNTKTGVLSSVVGGVFTWTRLGFDIQDRQTELASSLCLMHSSTCQHDAHAK